MYAAIFAILGIFSLPIRLDAFAAFGTGYAPSGYIRLRVYGIGLRLDWQLTRQNGKLDLIIGHGRGGGQSKRDVAASARNHKARLALLKQSPVLHRAIKSLIATLRVHARMRIGLGDAAATALACGFMQTVCGQFRFVRAQIIPEYSAKHSAAEIRCIAQLRMGKIALTAALYLLAGMMCSARSKTGGKTRGKKSHWRGNANGA